MIDLSVFLKNCYGINEINEVFNFREGRAKAFSIYAPNGLMKTSFSRVFQQLSLGKEPKEERYNRASEWQISADGEPISSELIYVLKSEIDIGAETDGISNVLVSPEHKERYDSVLIGLDKLKIKLLGSLQKSSKIPKSKLEQQFCEDFATKNFFEAFIAATSISHEEGFESFRYGIIFDEKTQAILKSNELLCCKRIESI